MNKLFFGIAIMLFSLNVFAQTTEEKEIRSTFVTYFEAMKNKDNAVVMEYIYPKLFTIVPKETLKAVFDQMYADTTIEISFDSSKINNIAPAKILDGTKYVLVNYSFTLMMKLKGEDRSEVAEIMHSSFENTYGKGNVRLDTATSTFYIHPPGRMLFINDKGSKEWKLLEIKTEYKEILDQLLPAEIIKTL